MNNISRKFFVLIIGLSGIMNAFAVPKPPAPNAKTPRPPGLPIDADIVFLLLIAVFLGGYVIYKYKARKESFCN